MSDLHKSDQDSPYADDLEFVRDYARRNDGYPLVQPVVDFINAHPDPQIIRTVEELEALDPETVLGVWNPALDMGCIFLTAGELVKQPADPRIKWAVIRDGADVRAARKALEKEANNG